MKFLVDMSLSPALAAWITDQGHDAVHAISIGLDRASDNVIFKRALEEQRVIIMADLDFPRLLAFAHTEEPGLILFRGGNYSEQEALSRLKRVLETIPQKELPSSVIVIEKDRIRRRRLPL